MNRIYLERVKKIYESAANKIYREYNLESNFDMIELLNNMNIDVIAVDELPNDWEYAFNNEKGKITLYYKDFISKAREERKKEYLKRILRFTLAMALGDIIGIYRLKEENLYKGELGGKIYCQGREKSRLCYRDFELEHFASNLLLPEVIVVSYVELMDETKGGFSYDELISFGESLGVNAQTICERCRRLRLI